MHSAPPEHLDLFISTLLSQDGISRNTAVAYRQDLEKFASWLQGKKKSLSVTTEEDIQRFLSECLNQQYKATSQSRFVSSLRRYFRFLLREGLIGQDPSADICMPKAGRYLPDCMTEKEVESLLEAPATHTANGLRDKTILELFYACGLRVSELISIKRVQLQLEIGCLRIVGKGNQERLVPMGEEAIEWLTQYLQTAREQLLKGRECEALFVSNRGHMMSRQSCWYMIKKMAQRAGISKNLSPHTLRHAFATHLLDHGADLRAVQMLLGHKNLSTTQIYTHVANQRMRNLHSQHHPRG